ncbi:hypothetical protein DY000_02063803 [Brassica cretica]|uniref:DNA-directed RNA polymerase n=1 Tax=Brassica cretica TaxID=69181 RepID=A0ABQ7B249_BRACR|nr:hypothetical protein DY000_02063803 [Brassica cretica]
MHRLKEGRFTEYEILVAVGQRAKKVVNERQSIHRVLIPGRRTEDETTPRLLDPGNHHQIHHDSSRIALLKRFHWLKEKKRRD